MENHNPFFIINNKWIKICLVLFACTTSGFISSDNSSTDAYSREKLNPVKDNNFATKQNYLQFADCHVSDKYIYSKNSDLKLKLLQTYRELEEKRAKLNIPNPSISPDHKKKIAHLKLITKNLNVLKTNPRPETMPLGYLRWCYKNWKSNLKNLFTEVNSSISTTRGWNKALGELYLVKDNKDKAAYYFTKEQKLDTENLAVANKIHSLKSHNSNSNITSLDPLFIVADNTNNDPIKRSKAYRKIASVYQNNKSQSYRSIEFLKKSATLNPNQPMVLKVLAKHYLKTGNPINAQKYIDQILKSDGSNVFALEQSGFYYLYQGKPKSALHTWKQIPIEQQSIDVIELTKIANQWQLLTKDFSTESIKRKIKNNNISNLNKSFYDFFIKKLSTAPTTAEKFKNAQKAAIFAPTPNDRQIPVSFIVDFIHKSSGSVNPQALKVDINYIKSIIKGSALSKLDNQKLISLALKVNDQSWLAELKK